MIAIITRMLCGLIRSSQAAPFWGWPMPTERIAMRKVREILRLTFDGGLPSREVARRVGVGSTGVRVMLQRFRASALTWPLPDVLTDTAPERELYGVAATRSGQRERAEPDWSAVNRELKRKHVTLQVLWDEYIEDHPAGYSYSRYCFLYRTWEGRLPFMRSSWMAS
ncbi:hypothetical protein [Sphingomonas sp. PP-CE-3G-477]|uniref:hypothetical protein n=1 Tax=Sphingomonas sp. PP-CE-3G-477 TaxID=2135660 RepID=UPI000D3D9DA8|nr:hypothetical protein [Sphingomonas sp. PP-CE-3G-477]